MTASPSLVQSRRRCVDSVGRMEHLHARLEAPSIDVLALRGELDLDEAPSLRARLEGAPGARALVVDLSAVTFIDSAVLKELLRARDELGARDVRLVLAGVTSPVRRLLELTRTSELFEQAPNADIAVRRLSA
jgi:anti-anti-sigma factor